MIHDIFLAFLPVFVAVDAVGTLPIFAALTGGLDRRQIRRVLVQSSVTALVLALGFIAAGKLVFGLLGIMVADFLVAGGLILLSLAVIDIVRPGKQRRMPPEEMGAVPLGTPLIAGPAVLTTSLIIIDYYGVIATIVSVVVNILLAVFIFSRCESLMRFLGRTGSSALSRVMALFLAAIAVMMIRKGIAGML